MTNDPPEGRGEGRYWSRGSNAHRALASGSRPQPRRQCPLDRVLLYVRREHGHKRAVRRIVSVRNDLLVDHAQRGEKDGPKRCDEPKSASFICSMNGSSSPPKAVGLRSR